MQVSLDIGEDMDIKEFLDLSEIEREELIRVHDKQKRIRAEREDIMLAEKKLEIRKINMQNECEHPNVTKTAKADTGNWCPQDDSYWYEFRCPDCSKFWTENQRKSNS